MSRFCGTARRPSQLYPTRRLHHKFADGHDVDDAECEQAPSAQSFELTLTGFELTLTLTGARICEKHIPAACYLLILLNESLFSNILRTLYAF